MLIKRFCAEMQSESVNIPYSLSKTKSKGRNDYLIYLNKLAAAGVPNNLTTK